ncbi:MAG: hypothetical protein ACTSQP_08230 [Promethearchaeota archaeon]
MKDFFNDIKQKYNLSFDSEQIARYIIGKIKDPKNDLYKSNILYGAFDADKLDYIRRDAYFSGLGLVLDIDRMLYSIDAKKPVFTDDYKEQKTKEEIILDNTHRQIICNVSNIGVFEQLIFNKMMLHTMMYHHHKIRAAECILTSLWEYIKNSDKDIISLNNIHNGNSEPIRFESIIDFLKLTDYDVLSIKNYENDKKASKICQKLINRNLPYRAAILSNQTLIRDNFKISEFINNMFISLKEQLEFKNNLIQYYNLKFNDNLNEIWVDIPKIMTFEESKKFYVEITENDFKRIVDLFKVDQRITSFSENKYIGIIYTIRNNNIRKNVFKITKSFLKKIYNIELNDMAFKLAKVDLN